jgi:hypothetical protein
MKVLDLVEAPIDMTSDPNDPTVYGHEKANPMSLKGRIMSARAQLKELAELADSDDLVAWERITQLHKGGMFMGLAQNLEQIRHGIEQLAAKRKQGGVASRGIDKNIGEQGVPEGAPIVVAQAPIDIRNPKKAPLPYRNKGDIVPPTKPPSTEKRGVKGRPGQRPMPDHSVKEGLKNPKDNPCWKGYKPVGTKKKGGRTVPNCVPKE